MTALAFLDNYQRLRQQFYPQKTAKKPRVKPLVQVVYDKPIGPVKPAFWVSDLLEQAHRLIEGGFGTEALTVKDPFAMKREVRQIIADIALIYGVTYADVMSVRRTQQIVRARQHIMFELSQRTPWSIAQIGRFLGRDHTSVLHGVKKHQKRIEDGEVTL